MFRRHFMQRITLAGAGGLASIGTTEARASRKVTYRVKGFSCVTCAVGLETMLRQEKGIARAEASYPDAKVTIEFDPQLVTGNWLRAFISDKGFTVEEEKRD
jgi:copper chaperone CopZ